MLFLVWAGLNLLTWTWPPLAQSLEYRADLLWSQPWRLITGHLIHLNAPHWLSNAVGLLLLWYLLSPIPVRCRTLWLASALPGLGVLLFFIIPGLEWYRGFSGVLHALWAAGAAVLLSTPGHRLHGLLLGGLLLLKLAWPAGQSLFDFPVVEAAHRLGALWGGLLAVISLHRCRATAA